MGNNIKRLRDVKGMKQEELAKMLHISQSEMSRLESKQEIDDEILERISEVLEFPVEAFKLDNLDDRICTVIQQCKSRDYVFNYTSIEKVSELYERWLAEKNAEIASLKEIIAMLKNQ